MIDGRCGPLGLYIGVMVPCGRDVFSYHTGTSCLVHFFIFYYYNNSIYRQGSTSLLLTRYSCTCHPSKGTIYVQAFSRKNSMLLMRSIIIPVFLIFPASIICVPDPFDNPILSWESNPYGDLNMDQSVTFDNDSGSTLTTAAIVECDPIGIQKSGKIRKRMAACPENDATVDPQNVPKAETAQDAITNRRQPQIPPRIRTYHPDRVPVRDRSHKTPNFWTLPVLAPDSSSSCPGIQEETELIP